MMNPSADALKRLRSASLEALHDLILGGVLTIGLLYFLPGWLRYSLMLIGSFCFLSSVIGVVVANHKPRQQVSNVFNKAVVITGCDSGFGHMLAAKLDKMGFQVFACCLFPEGEGAQKLIKSTSSRLTVIGMDVTKDDDVQKAFQLVENSLENNVLWAVVCNAGLNDGAEIFWTDMETFKRVVDVNLFGVIRVTKAFLPLITKSKGRVVAVSSAAGRHCFPGLGAYCISKHGVIAFCDSLRTEMYKFGVRVVTVEPWMYRTGIINEDMVRTYMKRAWDKAPENIKTFYPPEYFENFIENELNLLTDSISDNVGEVISCFVEAIAAKNPRCSYGPGPLKPRIFSWLLKKMPKPIYDLVLILPFMMK